MEPSVGLAPTTSSLPMTCSTARATTAYTEHPTSISLNLPSPYRSSTPFQFLYRFAHKN